LTTQIPALQEGHYSNLWQKIRQICFSSHQRLSGSLLRSRDILSRRLVWAILRLWDVRCYKYNYLLRDICESTFVLMLTMKAHGGEEELPRALLTSARYEGEWRASRQCRFTLGKEPEISIKYEAEWPVVPLWTFREKISPFPRWEQNHEMAHYILIK
jgi:hypothetical protein